MSEKPLTKTASGFSGAASFARPGSKACLLALVVLFPFFGITANGEVSDLASYLLYRKPLKNDWSEDLAERMKAGEPLPEIPEPGKEPADDADPATLLRYWRSDWNKRGDRLPSTMAREKILRSLEDEPSSTSEVLELLPRNERSARMIDRLHDSLPDASADDVEKRRGIRAWIYLHSGLRRDQVFRDVEQADWETYENSGSTDPTLHAIHAREPEEGTRLFREFAEGGKPGPAVVGAKLLMESATGEDREVWRGKLITMAADDGLSDEVKGIAVAALIRDDWEGREKWIISRLASENPGRVFWYRSPIVLQPDHWIPILVKLLNGENRHAHDHAVALLAEFHLDNSRADALRPLLPWLGDRAWSGADGIGRLRLIQSVSMVDIPECVPGLMAVVGGQDEEDSDVAYAAESLAHYKVKEAVPVLKASLDRCASPTYFLKIVRVIDELRGFSNEEVITALEAFYTACPDKAKRSGLMWRSEADMTTVQKVGMFFDQFTEKRQDQLEALERHLTVLDKDRPVIARQFRDLLIGASPSAAGDALEKFLADGTVTGEQIYSGLLNRKNPLWKGEAFRNLSGREGAVRGYAAVLSGQADEIRKVMEEDDAEALVAMLAAARLSGDALDFERVASLCASDTPRVAEAAAAYLGSRGEPEARRMLAARGGEAWDATRHTYGEFTELEGRVREEFKTLGDLKEVIGLRRFSPEGGTTPTRWCFFVYREDTFAVMDYGRGRVAVRRVPVGLFSEVRDYLSRYRVDDLPPLELMANDGIHYEYQHASAAGVTTVFMNNPPTTREDVLEFLEHQPENKGIVIYARLVRLFVDTFDQVELKPGFGGGIGIVVPREKADIRSVWKEGDDLRVLAYDSSESRRWRGVDPTGDQLTGTVAEPEACAILAEKADLHPKFDPFWDYRAPWRVRKGEATLHSGRFNDVAGLWWCRRGREPELLVPGTFAQELVSPDGKWCVAAKASGSGWAEPNTAVRINLETRQVIPLDLEPADTFSVVTFVPAHGKFLIMRRGGRSPEGKPVNGPEEEEHHLLDSATGNLEPVKGVFGMISQNHFRALQETGVPNVAWAAEPSYGRAARTVVGRYDSKAFTFTPVREIPNISFDSMAMWVSEKEGVIHAAMEGDLLKIPLSAE